jgi:ABC-type cobalamin/Fe3+-siderophores transport system ATPase subunit
MLLANGEVVKSGSATEVLTTENIAEYYGAKVKIISDNNGPIVIPERS